MINVGPHGARHCKPSTGEPPGSHWRTRVTAVRSRHERAPGRGLRTVPTVAIGVAGRIGRTLVRARAAVAREVAGGAFAARSRAPPTIAVHVAGRVVPAAQLA